MSLKRRFKVTDADKKYNTEAWKRYQLGNPAYIKAKLEEECKPIQSWKLWQKQKYQCPKTQKKK